MRIFLFLCVLLVCAAPARADDLAEQVAVRLQQALAGSPYTVTLSCDKGPDCAITIR